MTFKTVHLNLFVEDAPVSRAAIDYAIAFCEREKAHLSTYLAAVPMDVPVGRVLPLVHAALETINDERRERAEATRGEITSLARLAGVPSDCSVLQKPYPEIRTAFVAAARLSDCIILPKSTSMSSQEQGVVEAVLFGSGRPIIVVPAEWTEGPVFKRIAIAWDGGREAARAVGDAMPLLEQADDIEIVCATPDANKSAAGADLAQHLARHCRTVRLTELPMRFGNAGMTLRDYLATAVPDLMVMGAYAHPRLLQFILGGATSTVLSDAKVPVLYSH